MNLPNTDLRVDVDLRNPGHFFACCGLLEVAHRLWPGSEGWFNFDQDVFIVIPATGDVTLQPLIENLRETEVSGLTVDERQELSDLETEKRRLQGQRPSQKLSPEKERRRSDLGNKTRKGFLRFDSPLNLLLDWWIENDTPTTWSGRQEIHRIVRSAQEALRGIDDIAKLLDYGCVMRVPNDYCKNPADSNKAVEPFYFDARRFSHALSTGFSLDVIEAETVANPAVELLSLIGLQRCRPIVERTKTFGLKGYCDYWAWCRPLSTSTLGAVVGGGAPMPGSRHYRFPLLARDDQKRYGAFGWAKTIGGDL